MTAQTPAELIARPTRRVPVGRSSTRQLWSVAWFFGLSLALAVIAVVAGTPAALVPFILASGPPSSRSCSRGAKATAPLRRLGHSLTIRPRPAAGTSSS